MTQAKAYICVVLMQHENKHENRLLAELVAAPDEEQALVKASLLAHPGGHDNWTVLSKEVHEVDRDTLRRAAAEVLGWNDAAGAGTTA